jgi:hypothetical protein
MASVVTNLLAGGGGALLTGVSQVIDSIKGKNPGDALALQTLTQQYQTEFLAAQTDLAKSQMAEDEQLNATAGANIQADDKGDWFTRDARPAVIWVGLLILFVNYGCLSIIPPRFGYKPTVFPDLFWQVWGICVTGYVCARSADKLFGGSGGSLQLPFGIKADSKGD